MENKANNGTKKEIKNEKMDKVFEFLNDFNQKYEEKAAIRKEKNKKIMFLFLSGGRYLKLLIFKWIIITICGTFSFLAVMMFLRGFFR